MVDLTLPTLTDAAEEVKFDLFVKTHEVEQIIQMLQEIALLPSDERQVWVEEYQEVLSEMLESFLEDSLLAMDGMQLDNEAMEMSVVLVGQIREVMNNLQTILYDKRILQS